MEQIKNKNWKNSKYTQKVRIKKDDLDWIKKYKSNVSAAEFLSYIIKFYKKNK
jgi:hypothetical protein